MRSTMITKGVLGRITTGTRKKLFTKKKDFTWLNLTTREYNYNLLTSLHILMVSVNSNTRLGVTGLKEKIQSAKMDTFDHNIKNILTNIESNYNMILKWSFCYANIIMDIFNTLLTNKNTMFNWYIQHHKDSWEEG